MTQWWIFAFVVLLDIAHADTNCWWTGCQPPDWATRGCFASDGAQLQQLNMTDCPKGEKGNIYYCCPNAVTTTTTLKPKTDGCWWTGCQPMEWKNRGCFSSDGTTLRQIDMGECPKGEKGNIYHCCPNEESTSTVKPSSKKCWWTGCQPFEWKDRGCFASDGTTLEQVNTTDCTNGEKGNVYYCCSNEEPPVPTTTEASPLIGNCAWTLCIEKELNITESCPVSTYHKSEKSCENGETHECCNDNLPPEEDHEMSITDYIKETKFLLLRARNYTLPLELLPCSTVNDDELILNFDNNISLRLCDLCPQLPHIHLANVFINRKPTFINKEAKNLAECIGACSLEENCVAVSLDYDENLCYGFDSTAGDLTIEAKYTTVILNQPTHVIQSWSYTRHTSINGKAAKTLKSKSLLDCIAQCKESDTLSAMFVFSNQSCSCFSSIDDIYELNSEYGIVSAFELSLRNPTEDYTWRFSTDETENDNATAIGPASSSNSDCPQPKEVGLGWFKSLKCVSITTPECDSATGCEICYYPEVVMNDNLSYPLCPDSTFKKAAELKKTLNDAFKACSENEYCFGVDVNELSMTTESLTLDIWNRKSANLMRYHRDYWSQKSVFSSFTFIPNFKFPKELKQEKLSMGDCVSRCKSNKDCDKVVYSSKKGICQFGKYVETVIADEKQEGYFTFIKKPSINSPQLAFARSPGSSLNSKGAKNNFNCKENCQFVCLDKCLTDFKDWCGHVSMTYENDHVNCLFFEQDLEEEIVTDQKSDLFILYFRFDLSLQALNNLSNFQTSDLAKCFAKTNELSSETLIVPPQDTSVAVVDHRVKRNIFKKLWNGFVNKVVKPIANDIKDTFVNAGKAVKNVFQGNFKEAGKAFMNIPIVKQTKETVENGIEVVKAVGKGDWKKVGEKALDMVASAPLDIIPGVGRGLKIAGKVGKGILDSAKKKTKDIAGKTKNKFNDKGKKQTDDKKKENNNDNNNSGNDRCKRATNAKKRPNSSNDGNSCKRQKDNNCPRPAILNSYPESERDCARTGPGGSCTYECKPGYDEDPLRLHCDKVQNLAKWRRNGECKIEQCPAGNKILIPVRTPNPNKLTGRLEEKVVAYVVLFDKSRRLPIWSVSYMDKYNYIKSLARETRFFPHPCPQLQGRQGTDADYDFRWQKGHLTPANPLLWSQKIKFSANLYINGAPQDPKTNMNQWMLLEKHVMCQARKTPMIVATGVCKDSQGKTKGTFGLEIPTCFWKLVCYRFEGQTYVAGWLSSNRQLSKEAIVRELKRPKSQKEILTASGYAYENPWLRSSRFIFEGRLASSVGNIDTPVLPTACMGALELPKDEMDRWESGFNLGKKKVKRAADQTPPYRGCSAAEAKELGGFLGVSMDFDSDDRTFEDEGPDDSDQAGLPSLVPAAACNKRIIGYWTSWGKKKFTYSQARRLTHVVFAFIEMKSDGSLEIGSADSTSSKDPDSDAQYSKMRLQQLFEVARTFNHLKVMFAVGGWENSQYFSGTAGSADKRIRFIASALKLIDDYGFDGIDIDWEHPVTGGAVTGVAEDKQNYVNFLREIREAFDGHGNGKHLLISFAGAAGQWSLDPGYDLPGLLKYADWANIMSYDFFGAWESQWGVYTGPPAPLYFGAPPRFSGKTNVAWAVKYYVCKTQQSNKITMGVPFYGRFWKNVGPPIDDFDGIWRKAEMVNGKAEGGFAGWTDVKNNYINNPAFEKHWNDVVKTPYAFNPSSKVFLGYEDPKSLKEKVKYAVDKNLGGIMIWAIDQDDNELSMLNSVYDANLCNKQGSEVNFKCIPISDKRWWTIEDDKDIGGICGRSAPLYKGYYPVCDPDDPGYSCCSDGGYCGFGPKYCDCPNCADYGKYPEKILDEPIKPTRPVQWYFSNAKDGERGRCSKGAPLLNGKEAICNPDDPAKHCCSSGFYCGTGKEFCDCEGCVDYKKN